MASTDTSKDDGMSETLIPSHGLRWFYHATLAPPALQQRFTTPGGKEVWRDIPSVMGTLATPDKKGEG